MNRNLAFRLIGTLALFIAVLAPIFTLAAWLLAKPVWMSLLIAALLSPLAFYSFWYTLNSSHNMTLRWCWMQVLGIGTVLLLLVVIASFFTFRANPQSIGLVVLFAWPVLSAVALWQAHSITTRHLRIHAAGLDASLRMVQISDVHVGSRSGNYLRKVVNTVNAHNPDMVVITGDLLDASSVTQTDLIALADIQCPSYMCIGNHERYVDLDVALDAIAAHGVTILRDEIFITNGVQLIGVDDRDKPDALPELLARLQPDPNLFSVLLYHRPDGWHAAIQKRINLTLSGHTHAGQMFPFGLLVKRQYPQMAGLFTKENCSLFVSTGTGTWGPIFRLGTRNEMTVIDLHTEAVD